MTKRRWWPALVATTAVVGLGACSDGSGAPSQALTIYGSAGKPPTLASMSRTAGLHPSFMPASPTDSTGPSTMPITMYALYLSTQPDCSAPFLVQDYGTEGVVKDFVANPMLFQAEPAAGTYHCMIFRMSDVLAMKPSKSFGPCDSSQTYVGDIYRDGETDWIDQDGNPIVGHGTDDAEGAVDDHVAIFFTSDTAAAIARGVSPHQVVPLGSPLVAPGQSTLYWDMSGAVQDEGGYCSILPRPLYFE